MQTIDGITFNTEACSFDFPRFDEAFQAVFILNKYMAELSWMWLTALTNNRATLPQVRTILAGQSVGGISIAELMAVKRYGDAMKWLFLRVKNNRFTGDMTEACELNRVLCGSRETLTDDLRLQKAQCLLNALSESVSDPCQRAVLVFLALTRAKVFGSANTRTATLMMNGLLVRNGYWPVAVPGRSVDEFRALLHDFMATGRADEMLTFFAETAKNLYR